MMKNFEMLGLSNDVLSVLYDIGFENPLEIQEKTIPLALAGRDIIGGSATGSGKTLAFASSIIENLKPNKSVQALILTPTRELAEQVADSIRQFSKNKKLGVLAIYGGVNIEQQIRRISKSDIVVGTPGRILDHMQRRTLKLDNVKFLVLDEFDRMFDMGFHRDVEKIIKQCPENRQTMLFSATISPDLDHFAQRYTKNPVEISIDSYVDPSKLKQVYYDVEPHMKFSLLVHLLKKEGSDLVMVFCNTRRNADFIVSNLNDSGIYAKAIHGGLSQNKRSNVLENFHTKNIKILVCTDVAARGLDIKGVSHVYNYDLPPTSNDYIHRVGRTARVRENGKAVNILANRDYENFRNILKDKSICITLEKLPKFDILRTRLDFRRNRNRNFGRFKSNNLKSPRGNNFSRGRRDNSDKYTRNRSNNYRLRRDEHRNQRNNNYSRSRVSHRN